MTHHPSEFARRVYTAAEAAIGDHENPSEPTPESEQARAEHRRIYGTDGPTEGPFAEDFDVLAHLRDSSVSIEDVRSSLRDLGDDYLHIDVLGSGKVLVLGVENPLPPG